LPMDRYILLVESEVEWQKKSLRTRS